MSVRVNENEKVVHDGARGLIIGHVVITEGGQETALHLAVELGADELDTASLEELEGEQLLHHAEECAEALMAAEVAS